MDIVITKMGIPVVTKIHPLSGKTFSSREEISEIRKSLFGHYPGDKVVEAFPMSVCMSLYKMEVINRFNLRFKKILSEDTIFNIAAYSCAKTISFVSYTDYCYRKEEQASITKSFSPNKKIQFKEFLMTLKIACLKKIWSAKLEQNVWQSIIVDFMLV